jgi:putative transposase
VAGFNYRGLRRYFITVCTASRRRWFADPRLAEELTTQIPLFFEKRGLAVLAYCLMPDHLHLLLEGTREDADLVGAVFAWKQATGFAWKRRTGTRLWQKGFHDRVLRDGDDLRAVVRYVLENPVRARLCRNATEYPWTGSSRYELDDLLSHAGEWTPPWRSRRRAG